MKCSICGHQCKQPNKIKKIINIVSIRTSKINGKTVSEKTKCVGVDL